MDEFGQHWYSDDTLHHRSSSYLRAESLQDNDIETTPSSPCRENNMTIGIFIGCGICSAIVVMGMILKYLRNWRRHKKKQIIDNRPSRNHNTTEYQEPTNVLENSPINTANIIEKRNDTTGDRRETITYNVADDILTEQDTEEARQEQQEQRDLRAHKWNPFWNLKE